MPANYSLSDISLFGNLANNSYTETNPIGYIQPNTDYTLTNQTYDSVSSFGGQSYYSATDNRLVISYQGTSSSGDLLLTDLFGPGLGWTGSLTNQSAAARLFTEQALQSVSGTNTEIVFVGHSLGGFLAQENLLFSDQQNVNAVVFNSPGVGGLSAEFTGDAFLPTDTNTTYVYSESWGFAAPIHGIGGRISDNVYFVAGTSGHGIVGLLANIESSGITLYSDVPSLTAALETEEITFKEVIDALDNISDPNAQNLLMEALTGAENNCFGAGSPVDMWPVSNVLKPRPDGVYDQDAVRAGIWQKPIEEVTTSDTVVSFDDKTGNLVPGTVKRTMTNNAKIILDFHGTFVTPGHVCWCAGGKYEGKYAPLIDILRDDGVIQHQDGTLIRASTGCEVGTPDDEEFHVFKLYKDAQGNERVRDKTKLRYGTRWMIPSGQHCTMREYMEGIGVEILKDGPQRGYARWKETGITTLFAWVLSDTLPNPEDFVLARSATSLEDIYKAGQWEFMQPTMPPPMVMDGGPVQPLSERTLEMLPRNLPMVFSSAAPSSEMLPDRNPQMNRRQRKAAEAKAKRAAKNKRPKGATLH